MRAGFTLLELLIAISVSIVAGSILVSLMTAGNGLFYQQGSKINQGLSLNDSVNEISNLIKISSSIASSYPASSPQYSTDSNTLILSIPSIDSTGKVINNTYDFAVIARDATKNNILRLQVFPNPLSSHKSQNQVLSTTLSSVTFLYYDNNDQPVSPTSAAKINFTVNLTEKAGYGNQSSSASGQVNLKNN